MVGSVLDAAGGAMFGNGQSGSEKPISRNRLLVAWLSAVMATSLVLSELLTVEGSLVWALGRTLHLASGVQILLVGLGAVVSLWLSFLFFRTALRYERNPAHQD